MLSTFHKDDMLEKERKTKKAGGGREIVKKPKMVEGYNTYTWEE